MSSPIAIPRDQPSSASASSSLSTSNGKYVPVHKRAGAAPTPASPAPSNSTSGRASPRSRRGRHARQTSAVSNYEHNHHDIPIHTSIPTVYSIADLLAFSTTASPGPQLSLDQRADGGVLPRFVRAYISTQHAVEPPSMPLHPPPSSPSCPRIRRGKSNTTGTVPPCLHRVIIEFLPLSPSHGTPISAVHLTAIAHAEMFRRLAEQLHGADENGAVATTTKRTLQMLQAPMNLFFLSENQCIPEFSVAKWLERSTGTGKGCWI
ncbi:hypothetical protein EUX98_g7319 [Antrodiella citrinella]|uniref:Uncharacterized protein n=1 Tax=Antrodiella citrinella TaxID=2447956 RepID=A0A4S4MMD9_9APHY|nr:hypothetical protein EUX98_g7319 [Antrodiella citrinella]